MQTNNNMACDIDDMRACFTARSRTTEFRGRVFFFCWLMGVGRTFPTTIAAAATGPPNHSEWLIAKT